MTENIYTRQLQDSNRVVRARADETAEELSRVRQQSIKKTGELSLELQKERNRAERARLDAKTVLLQHRSFIGALKFGLLKLKEEADACPCKEAHTPYHGEGGIRKTIYEANTENAKFHGVPPLTF